MHCVLHYQNNSIRELFERLERHGVSDPSKYLSFTSLRTWSELCGTPITELIYIHSKVSAYQIPPGQTKQFTIVLYVILFWNYLSKHCALARKVHTRVATICLSSPGIQCSAYGSLL